MDYVIGVDCGGTNTTAIAYQLSGHPIAKVVTGPANLMVDDLRALNNTRNALQQLLAKLDGTCQAVTIGIAGLRAYPFIERFRQRLNVPVPQINLMNDAQLAQLAKLQGKPGLVTIAGTGSVVSGTNGRRQFSAGGWGHLLGDEGSGYHLSRLAVQQLTTETDAGTISPFSQALLAQLKLKSIFELIDHFYQWDKGHVARLAPFVLAQAADHDPHAVAIVQTAVAGLAQTILYARQKGRWSKTDTVNLAFAGSVLEKSSYYREALRQQLAQSALPFNYVPITPDISNAIAAVYAYKN
ncbi:BadF/BadG/BcrA/BcrD ATPase family protein [Lactiplantibacillus sp. WILCCON 0030]|uniref:BadF/BadG/BcrA/BcrD ATPase family protein n=1 Tax=Lactiplantibacillus brownii TaxID=3069269 RepID=A0ABU1ACJ4_9LACO|nr:BadF/BadG/BcrA/BcrD ATPase family protein [Lactiplantibacillus brownii]MDQ7938650.1 BadF/BadG/BcrA/BcrD ATPase family protein [Lactiplantibacillus brownii]